MDVGQTSRTPRIPRLRALGVLVALSTRWTVGKTSWVPSSPGSFISSYYLPARVAAGKGRRRAGRVKTGIQPATDLPTDRRLTDVDRCLVIIGVQVGSIS